MTTCSNCKHYHQSQKLGEGECRRFPPSVSIIHTTGPLGQPAIIAHSVFPTTKEGNACGEFAIKLKAVAA